MKILLIIAMMALVGCDQSVIFEPETLVKGTELCEHNGGIVTFKVISIHVSGNVTFIDAICKNGLAVEYRVK